MHFISGAPRGIEFNSVKEVLLTLKSVKALHSLHLWALTVGQSLVSVHLAIGKENLNGVDICTIHKVDHHVPNCMPARKNNIVFVFNQRKTQILRVS